MRSCVFRQLISVVCGGCLVAGLAGCKGSGPGVGKRGARGQKPPAKELTLVDSVDPYMQAAYQALRQNDVEAATVEIRGAQSLLQQTLVEQRAAQTAGEQTDETPQPAWEPLLESADQHAAAAKQLTEQSQWTMAASHLQTGESLLQVATNRIWQEYQTAINKLSQERNEAQQAIASENEQTIAEAGDDAQKRAAAQQDYQEKLTQLNKDYAEKRQSLQQEADKQRGDLTKKRCELLSQLATVFKQKGDEQQATYYTTRTHQELASLYESQQDNEAAAAEYEKWVKVRPEDVFARMGLARALTRADKLDEAAAQYREALKRNPADTRARLELGSLLRRQQKWDDAIAQWKQIIAATQKSLAQYQGEDEMSKNQRQRLKGEWARYQFDLAGLYREAGKLDAAKNAYAKAAELDPGYAGRIPEDLK